MNNQQQMIKVLSQLRQLRQQGKDQLISQLAKQNQLVKRYLNNVEALTQLITVSLPDNSGGVQMQNLSHYKAVIQRVVDWQKQEHALATVEAEHTRQALQHQACEEMRVALILKQQQQALALSQQRTQQNITDDQALSCWLRRRQS